MRSLSLAIVTMILVLGSYSQSNTGSTVTPLTVCVGADWAGWIGGWAYNYPYQNNMPFFMRDYNLSVQIITVSDRVTAYNQNQCSLYTYNPQTLVDKTLNGLIPVGATYLFCSDISIGGDALFIKTGVTKPSKIAANYYSYLFQYLKSISLTSGITIVPFTTSAQAEAAFLDPTQGFDTIAARFTRSSVLTANGYATLLAQNSATTPIYDCFFTNSQNLKNSVFVQSVQYLIQGWLNSNTFASSNYATFLSGSNTSVINSYSQVIASNLNVTQTVAQQQFSLFTLLNFNDNLDFFDNQATGGNGKPTISNVINTYMQDLKTFGLYPINGASIASQSNFVNKTVLCGVQLCGAAAGVTVNI